MSKKITSRFDITTENKTVELRAVYTAEVSRTPKDGGPTARYDEREAREVVLSFAEGRLTAARQTNQVSRTIGRTTRTATRELRWSADKPAAVTRARTGYRNIENGNGEGSSSSSFETLDVGVEIVGAAKAIAILSVGWADGSIGDAQFVDIALNLLGAPFTDQFGL